MTTPTSQELTSKRCVPCEGGIPALSAQEARCAGAECHGLDRRLGRQTDLAIVDGQELHGRDRLFQQGRRARRGRRASPRPSSRRVSPGEDRPLDPRRRRPYRKRLHPRRQDQRGTDSGPALRDGTAGLFARMIPVWSTIQSPIVFRASGAIVVSIVAYSLGEPVLHG